MRTVHQLIGLGCILLSISTTHCDSGSGMDPAQTAEPIVSAVSPQVGPNSGGTTITISGQNFQSGASVTVGGAPCTNVSVVSATQITCTTPAKAATCGLTAVAIQNPSGLAAMRGDLFAYQSATLGFANPTTVATGLGPRFITLADFNGDNKVDLAVSLITSGQVNIHNGDGAGGFAAGNGISTGMQPRATMAKDLNGDGKPDLVVINQLSNNATVHINTGSGFGNPLTVNTGMGPEGAALVDLNGDGKLDLVTANNMSGNVSILLGTGNGNFAAAQNVTTANGTQDVVAFDVNGDGKLDLVTANSTASSYSVLIGNGNGTFAAAANGALSKAPAALVTGDAKGV